jgi:hypothetical protein
MNLEMLMNISEKFAERNGKFPALSVYHLASAAVLRKDSLKFNTTFGYIVFFKIPTKSDFLFKQRENWLHALPLTVQYFCENATRKLTVSFEKSQIFTYNGVSSQQPACI